MQSQLISAMNCKYLCKHVITVIFTESVALQDQSPHKGHAVRGGRAMPMLLDMTGNMLQLHLGAFLRSTEAVYSLYRPLKLTGGI